MDQIIQRHMRDFEGWSRIYRSPPVKEKISEIGGETTVNGLMSLMGGTFDNPSGRALWSTGQTRCVTPQRHTKAIN